MAVMNEIFKKYFWAVILVFLGLAAYLSAGIFSSAVSSKLQASESVVLPHESDKPKPPPSRDKMLRMIVDRSLFNSETVGQNLRGHDNGAEEVETDLNVELNGTVIWGEEGSWAIITDKGGNSTDVYAIGDMLVSDATIVGIEAGLVRIDRDGEEQVLKQIPYSSAKTSSSSSRHSGSTSSGSSRRSSSGNQGVKEIGDGEYQVTRDYIETLIENPASLAGQVRGRPVEDGFKFGRIPKNSVLSQLGLKRGDIVTNINGRPANNTAELLKLLTDIGSTSTLNIEVLRNGETVPLSINLR